MNPYESKIAYIPAASSNIDENLVILCDQVQWMEKFSASQESSNRRSRSHSLLSFVTDDGQRRKSPFLFEAQNQLKSRNSFATTSISESTNNDLLCAPIQLSSPKLYSLTFFDEDQPSKRSDSVEDSETIHDIETSCVKSIQDEEDNEDSTIKDGNSDNDEVVSTYLDLHFPPSSLHANKSDSDNAKPATDNVETSKTSVVATNNTDDDTINL